MILIEFIFVLLMVFLIVDMVQIFVVYVECVVWIDVLCFGNKDCFFDGFMVVGIIYVIVIFDGVGDSGQIESIGVWFGEIVVDFFVIEIEYVVLIWDDFEVEMWQFLFEDVVE